MITLNALDDQTEKAMNIDIYSDVVCPWCYIGKKRLDSVLKSPIGEGLDLVWRPYQLFPQLPAQGLDRRDYLIGRHGAATDPGRIPDRIRAEAVEVGINMDYANIKRMPNTFDAHRLLDSVSGDPRQHDLAETLFRYYFCEGKDLGDHAILEQAATETGIQGAAALLAGDAGADQVKAQLSEADQRGITGVPSYLLAGRFTLPGAQTTETIAHFIQQAQRRLT